jgi:hypothetical protein
LTLALIEEYSVKRPFQNKEESVMGEYVNISPWLLAVFVIGIGMALALAHYQSRGTRKIRHRFECGHRVPLEGTEVVDGEYCPNCVKEAIIQCACCGEPIHPGDIVMPHFHDYSLHGKPSEGAVLYPFEDGEEYGQTVKLVACTRHGCAEPGSYKGRWVMPGVVNKITPLGHAHHPAGSLLLN